MNRFKGNVLLYYFITISSGVLTYTWGRRSFLESGNENMVAGYFILFGVIASIAVFSLRRSTYRKIMMLEPRTYKRMTAGKGKQRPLEMAREKGERYSPQIEELIATYNTFRMVSVAMIVISLAANMLLLR